jgi:hypothetical protein
VSLEKLTIQESLQSYLPKSLLEGQFCDKLQELLDLKVGPNQNAQISKNLLQKVKKCRDSQKQHIETTTSAQKIQA